MQDKFHLYYTLFYENTLPFAASATPTKSFVNNIINYAYNLVQIKTDGKTTSIYSL